MPKQYAGLRRGPPMLSTAELRAIAAASSSPETRRLLWDLFALRVVARRARQLLVHMGRPGDQRPPIDTLMAALEEELAALPFLNEDDPTR